MNDDSPQGLTDILIAQAGSAAEALVGNLVSVSIDRARQREILVEQKLLHHIDPGTDKAGARIAVDGGMVIASRSNGDIVVVSATEASMVEPASPPRHKGFVDVLSRHMDNTAITRGLMATYETELAATSDCDLVMVDGSFISQLISIGDAFGKLSENPDWTQARIGDELSALQPFMDSWIHALLTEPRFIACPKYTTTRAFSSEQNILPSFARMDTRLFMSLVLAPGEISEAIPLLQNRQQGRFIADRFRAAGFDIHEDLPALLARMCSIYFRPHESSPAIRLDMSRDLYENGAALAGVLAIMSDEMSSPGIQEPVSLYLVDRQAKQVSDVVDMTADLAMAHSLEQGVDTELLTHLAKGYRT